MDLRKWEEKVKSIEAEWLDWTLSKAYENYDNKYQKNKQFQKMINPKKTTPTYHISKLIKNHIKEKIIKAHIDN